MFSEHKKKITRKQTKLFYKNFKKLYKIKIKDY